MGTIRMVNVSILLTGIILLSCLPGCTNVHDGTGLVAGATAFAAHSPNNEIEQIYYVGVFDPQEQVEPAVYRIRVHGQASAISETRFASGWVPAAAVDSLGTTIAFKESKGMEIVSKKAEDRLISKIKTGRHLIIFRPKKFREAPTNHRLVILMGANPDGYFKAIQTALGEAAQELSKRESHELGQKLFNALADVQSQDNRMSELKTSVDSQLGTEEGGE